ncbi:Lactose permease [Vanrija pseudolonga]|uniref:Lactose permease n=1 Tax=Vanrija pseudolonga TaxID=143232 RepID=A0AAF0Y6D6_9TREE|nr:Lactose permease [Vanrija pseudolonga]
MGVPGAVTSAGVSSSIQSLLAGRDTRWYRGHLGKLNGIIFFVLIMSMTNGYDGSMMNGLTALDNWRTFFKNPQTKPTLFGVYNAIQSIGTICGLPFAPYASDYLGRRGAIFLACTIMILASGLQAGAQNVAMFIASRFLIGFGVSFGNISAPVLVSELAFPTHRGPLTSLYNSMWYLGAIVAAWTTFGTFRIPNTWSWRIPSLLQGLPSVIQFGMIYFIPESPRWLIAHGKDEQAIAFLRKYHCGGDENDPLAMFEYEEIKSSIEREKEMSAQSSWKALFTERANLRRIRIIVAISFFSQWSGNGLVSYYLAVVLEGIGITSQNNKTLINGILQIWNWFWAILGALNVERVGRRFLFLTSTGGMCICFCLWTACSAVYAKSSHDFDPACVAKNKGDTSKCVAKDANRQAGHAVVAFIFLFNAFYAVAMSPLVVSYCVEILPFRVRSKGVMVKSMTISAALVFNQYVNPIALAKIHWKYYIVFCAFLAFEFVYCFFFVMETRGPNGPLPLEEIAAIFEGPAHYGFQKRPEIAGARSDDEAVDSDSIRKDNAEFVERK